MSMDTWEDKIAFGFKGPRKFLTKSTRSGGRIALGFSFVFLRSGIFILLGANVSMMRSGVWPLFVWSS